MEPHTHMEGIKIGIADNQARIRLGLGILLDQQPGWHVIIKAADGLNLIDQVKINSPDIALVDWDLPGIPIEILLKYLHEISADLLVVLLCGRSELRQSALMAGANAFASKTEPPEKLIQLIEKLLKKQHTVVD